MAANGIIAQLGGWDGYEVQNGWDEWRGGDRWCVIRLRAVPGIERCCSGCGRSISAVHDSEERRVRDLPMFDAAVELLVPRLRLRCDVCGPKLERLNWLAPYARVTVRLAASVARLCKVTSVRHVAAFYGLGWPVVKLIDKRALERELGPADFSDVRVLGMDEFALHKGHRYATVLVEVQRKRVLWVGRGRGREDVRPFFELLGAERCKQVQAVVMDMNTGYELEVRQHCPQADVVFDLFHVLAKYGREVIDRVRVDEANRLRHDRPARRLVKSARWLLLRNRDNVAAEDQVRLDELLEANRALFTVYVLKDDLKALCDYRHAGYAQRFWQHWYRRAVRSRIAPLVAFARKLKPYLPGILAHCRWPLGTNLIEGINNKIKVIKRMAYGFRDEAYFFLKIRAAFPGIR